MSKFIDAIEIFLQPGDFYFGDKDTRIITLLGSCVAITIWHPSKLIGGMCHYMLPENLLTKGPKSLDGKYAQDVIKMFLQEVKKAKTHPSEYQAKVFGGGHMFSNIIQPPPCLDVMMHCKDPYACQRIACRNAMVALSLLKKNGFTVISCDLGGSEHRKVIFDVWSGDVWIRRGN